ncbi:spore germination protein PE [Cohnella sp. OV330]|uniref:spore germination protein GerPE n=1 Tax=Cohnella sp. OV330 TaxID=1855288 RepID=UPI0008E45FF2|nr:spore germination protein GerPE [Cohnella sp. OV330]SFB20657.1 spore germination protein PE [Cohnella sp. OV330]
MSLSRRVSAVGLVYINSASDSSVVHFGDNRDGARLKARVLAVQRSVATFKDNEFPFASYSLFTRPLPVPPPDEGPAAFFESSCAPIEIGTVQITAISAASHVRFGNGGPETAETRIVNIRNRIPGVQPRVEVDFK